MELIKELKETVALNSDVAIQNLFDKLTSDTEVYSTYTINFSPLLFNKSVYMFATTDEVVLILIDKVNRISISDELADEEEFCGEPPLYFSYDSHRTSPVYLLSMGMKALQKSLSNDSNSNPGVYGVLLTNSFILNYDDMLDVWEDMNISVAHNLSCITFKIKTNSANDLPGATIFKNYINRLMSGELTEPMSVELNADTTVNNLFPDIKSDMHKSENMTQHSIKTGDDVQTLPAVEILDPIDNPQEVLKSLVGIKEVKAHINELISLSLYNDIIRKYYPNGCIHDINLHAVFTGSVGTGKTTIGRIYGSLLHEVGMLSKGHVVLANRSSFIGKLWGTEEENTRAIINLSQGGVLFIDEAYELCTENEKDPGRHVLQLMLEVLADESNRDIAIVIAGYEKQIASLLAINPGLESRFKNRFHFDDFSYNELLQITKERLMRHGYSFTHAAWLKYKQLLAEEYKQRDVKTFGNGRFIANLLEQIYIRHAIRCVKNAIHDENIFHLTTSDIPTYRPHRNKTHVGFRVNE
jgi:hypothetical protein